MILWTITEPCSNIDFPRGEQKNFHSLRIFVFLHGLMIWLVMQRSVWNDIVSWQTRRLSNSTKYPLHASMTTTSRRKKCRVGLFQDSDFAGDLEDSKTTSGGTSCIFWKSDICSHKLDVQETNCNFSQFNRI